jgi:hypothetical protein
VQAFVKKYSLSDLAYMFKGLSWEQLLKKPTNYFGKHAKRVTSAIDDEKSETDAVDQLILNDIAIFTG